MHAIITGGSSGIGLATARLLSARGATVSLLARGAARLEAAAQEIGAHSRAVDVSDEAALTTALQELEGLGGPCDVLISCAGLARPGRFLELEPAVFREMIEVDYFGTLYAIRAVAPGMVERGRGSIVAVSSAAGLLGIYGYSAYGPAKFAVRGLMESLRAELTPHGVHVGVVFPPDVDTPQLADENRFKPAETFAISGTIKPLSPEAVAASIVLGIDKRRFLICPDTGTKLLARLGGVLAPVLNWSFDRKVRSVTPGSAGARRADRR
ncbi:SDR family oxidoreductase [Lentzea tibetensis]|nr:SDR family oxidoreductase [Lentzea tibetensis]